MRIWVSLALVAGLVFAESSWCQAKDSTRYDTCIELTGQDPLKALDQALAWRDEGGGSAARHCIALAFMALGEEEEAAQRLERLALEPGSGGARERSVIMAQAGSAWLLAMRPDQADVALTSAIDLDSSNPELFVDRAIAHRMRKNWTAAIADLTRAIEIDRSYLRAFVLRAVAKREAGDLAGAQLDIDRGLEIDPRDVDALVERGRLREILAGRAVE